VNRKKIDAERRRWPRLPLAIPVFVRTQDEDGRELLEFASALNVSAGGALVAVRRPLPLSGEVSLEVPCAPLGVGTVLPKASRHMSARALRIVHQEGYHLVGLKFSHPLYNGNGLKPAVGRKVASTK
jgi:hypothetical protein